MHSNLMVRSLLSALLVWGVCGVAQAAVVVFETSELTEGLVFSTTPFEITQYDIDRTGNSPFDVTLSDFEFPVAYEFLALNITTATDTVLTLTEPGTAHFEATPGTYFANLVTLASELTAPASDTPINVGSFGVEVTAVPLPPAVVLFGSALVGLVGLGRRGRKQTG